MTHREMSFPPSPPLAYLSAVLMLLAAAYVAVLAAARIQLPYPLEVFEGTTPLNASLLLEGKGLYALTNRPAYINVYGPLYYFLVAPFAYIFGNSILTHRFFSVSCLLLQCLFLYRMCRFDGAGKMCAGLASLLLFIQLGQSINTIARSDSLASLCYFASVAVAWRFRFHPLALAGSILLSLAAFYSKPYFIWSMAILAGYALLRRDRRYAPRFIAAAILATVLSFYAVSSLFETYLIEVFAIHIGHAKRSAAHSIHLFSQFLLVNWSFVALGGMYYFTTNQRHSDDEALCPIHISTFAWLLTLLPLLFVLGPHYGNGIVYYQQLAYPFLYWTAGRQLGRLQSRLPIAWLAAGITAATSIYLLAALPKKTEDWPNVQQVIEQPGKVLVGPTLSYLAGEVGKPVYENGLTSATLILKQIEPGSLHYLYCQRRDEQLLKVREMIRNKEFDTIIYHTEIAFTVELAKLPGDTSTFSILDYYKPVETYSIPIEFGAYLGQKITVEKVQVLKPLAPDSASRQYSSQRTYSLETAGKRLVKDLEKGGGTVPK